ncbi:MAG: NADH-quinone oxidoreductase subunit NuoE [Gammaproteobacteria bacterium]|nr:NADH-quinone oxidoreductase subunit NuoE [Gammaproteobacteria bacterium]
MNTNTKTQFEISTENKAQIDRWLKKYPPEQKRSAVVEALLMVQEQNNGWLSEAAMQAVADYLCMPPIEVYEVATFYDMYELAPTGRHKIAVCTNVSCMLRGSDKIIHCIEKRLNIKMGETTQDGKFTLREVECLAACAGAPMCQIDNKAYHEHLTPEKMLELIDEIDQGAK